jgi:glycosyltransferase involved in cell wall biosynthesis
MNTVCIVVVTRNRLEMLKECVREARKNAEKADVLIVDNASTDGTGDWLKTQDGIISLLLRENTGGAGGFAAGMNWAHAHGYEWLWIMDDDVKPLPQGLSCLLHSACAFGAKMIQPTKLDARGRIFEHDGILDEQSLRRIRLPHARVFAHADAVPCTAANFEGLFLHRSVIDAVGLPPADFFLAMDDAYYGWLASRHVAFIYIRQACVQKQFDKERLVVGGRRYLSSSPFSRFFHVRNFVRIIRLERLGLHAWMRFLLEFGRAALLTLLIDMDIKGLIWLFIAIRDGWRGDLADSNRRFLGRSISPG